MGTEHIVKACTGQAFDLRQGERIAIIDLEGQQVVDFFAVSAADPGEFLSTGVTIDCNESLKLKQGDTVYTSRYNEMFAVERDDVGEHDLLYPCCRPEMYDFFYGNGTSHRNCLDNINGQMERRGWQQHGIIHPVNLFMHTVIRADGTISVEQPLSKPGDRVTLRALMDATVVLAACSVAESQCNGGKCTPVGVVVE